VSVPASFVVAEKLNYDVIIGLDLLSEMEAVIDARTNALVLFDGLTAVPMTKTGEHLVVRSVSSVTIPPFSEAII